MNRSHSSMSAKVQRVSLKVRSHRMRCGELQCGVLRYAAKSTQHAATHRIRCEQNVTITMPIWEWYVMLLVTLDIAYLCKKFNDSSFSYSWGMFRALKCKVDQVTWPRPFQGRFVVRIGLDLLWSICIPNLKYLRLLGNFIGKNSKIAFCACANLWGT